MNQLKNSPIPGTTVVRGPEPRHEINRGICLAELVQIHNDERRKSNFTNHIIGMIVSGTSPTPRIQESGEVEMQASSTYTAKWEMSKPEHLLGQALIMAVNAPLARAFHFANPALAPAFSRMNEQTRVTKECTAMTSVASFAQAYAQFCLGNGASQQQRECLKQLRQWVFGPVSKAPLHNADLPKEFRGLSEMDASASALLKLAEAVNEHDVINKGLEMFHTSDQSVLKGLGAFEKGLVQDYAAQAGIMRSAARLCDGAIKTLYAQMTATMQKLGTFGDTVRDTVEEIRKDPAAMDPITAFSVLAKDIAKKQGKAIEAIYRLLEKPEDNFKRSVPASAQHDFGANNNIHMAVMEQLAKDLTDVLGAWPQKPGEQWKDVATGAPFTFPDGSPRVSTPFDKILATALKYFQPVRAKYFDMVTTCINSEASYYSVLLLVGGRIQDVDRKTVVFSTKDAARLAVKFVNAQNYGTIMNPQEGALAEHLLQIAGPSTAYLDETMRLYTHSVLIAGNWLLGPALTESNLL